MKELQPFEKRFIAEYYELDDRAAKLNAMLCAWGTGELKFRPKCPKELLDRQFQVMQDGLYPVL